MLEATSQLIQVLKQRGPEKAVDIDDAAQRVALEVTWHFPLQLTHENTGCQIWSACKNLKHCISCPTAIFVLSHDSAEVQCDPPSQDMTAGLVLVDD